MDQIRRLGAMIVVAGAVLFAITSSFAAEMHTSGPFKGVKANTGRVIHSVEGGKQVLTLSHDFKNPDAPDPHWQVIDSKGNVYMLQKLTIKGDMTNKKIVLPSYIKDVAKVQMWCAFAETNLGEAVFDKPIMLSSK
ncbi:MAG TPA: hypothetical protein VNL14_04155 [Candidatus Acidoferrales bacterium]|nr:hypothetical protein [Candidatus Acidoferrales bacterium]